MVKIILVGFCKKDEYTNYSFTYPAPEAKPDQDPIVGQLALTLSMKTSSFESLGMEKYLNKEFCLPGRISYWKNELKNGKIVYTPYLKADSL